MKFILFPSFPGPQDAALHNESSDSSMSDYQPPAKRKYVFKNKAHASAIICSRRTYYFCPHIAHKHNKTRLNVIIIIIIFPVCDLF